MVVGASLVSAAIMVVVLPLGWLFSISVCILYSLTTCSSQMCTFFINDLLLAVYLLSLFGAGLASSILYRDRAEAATAKMSFCWGTATAESVVTLH